MNENLFFWKMAFINKAIDTDLLSQAVKCTENPCGEITKDEYKAICNEDFIESTKIF